MAEQKVAIVTGAGTGIGKAVALALAKDGYAVVLAGRRADKLEETAREAGNAKTLSVPTDVSDPESIKALFARTKKEFGRLDLLFNNAGIGAPAVPMEELPLETWRKVVDTNLTGVFVCTQEAVKIMMGRGVELADGETVSLPIPARAELVIEGVVREGDVAPEGPLGEFTGYYGRERSPQPVIEVTALHMTAKTEIGRAHV